MYCMELIRDRDHGVAFIKVVLNLQSSQVIGLVNYDMLVKYCIHESPITKLHLCSKVMTSGSGVVVRYLGVFQI